MWFMASPLQEVEKYWIYKDLYGIFYHFLKRELIPSNI